MNQLAELRLRIEALVPRAETLWTVPSETEPPQKISGQALGMLGKIAAQPPSLRLRALKSGSMRRAFEQAVQELERNVAELEALAGEVRCPPFAYVTWAWRVHQCLVEYHQKALAPRHVALSAEAPGTDGPAGAGGAFSGSEPERDGRFRPAGALCPPLSSGQRGRVDAIDPLLDLAARETSFLQRRRRLLEAARRALLETQASQELTADEVQPRLLYVAEQIRTLNQLQVLGVRPTVDLLQQLKQATARRDAEATRRCLLALAELERLGGGRVRVGALLARSQGQLPVSVKNGGSLTSEAGHGHPQGVLEAVTRGLDRARHEHESGVAGGSLGVISAQLAGQGLGPRAVSRLFAASASIDGCFELGRSVAPVRSREEQARLRQVPFPTQTLVLRPAECVTDIPQSLVGDPRTVLLDFATGRLLARRYLASPREASAPGERIREVRYYLLDGSDSMAGRRGVLRDAMLVSELSSLIEFLSEPGAAAVRPVVYYRYFTNQSEPTRRVATREEALEAIEDCLGRLRRGKTDIESALVTSFEEIRLERQKDDSLKKVHLVLVTDGVASVDLKALWAARGRLGSIPVGVSVVALGSENAALKQLSAAQRRAGQEVFYHYLPDRSLRELVEPPPTADFGAGQRSEPDPEIRPAPENASDARPPKPEEETCWQELECLVDEVLTLESRTDVEEVEQGRFLLMALGELGLSLQFDFCDAERARHESLRRDERILQRRFDRWFPPALESAANVRDPEHAPEPLATIEAFLATVVEVVELLDGAPLQRRYDAIEVMERLLLEAAIPPWLYARELAKPTTVVRQAVAEVRRAVAARD